MSDWFTAIGTARISTSTTNTRKKKTHESYP